MTTGAQTSLFFEQRSEPGTAANATGQVMFCDLSSIERTELAHGAWIDVQRTWVRDGFALYDELKASPEWRAERRQMFHNVVAVPRLLRYFRSGETVPWPEVVDARQRLSSHYYQELGEGFTSTGLCLYRDGRDSVAWHGDTLGRGATHDTLVAIVSLGASRVLALRPRVGGPSLRLTLDHGDLVVMGGSCQRTWEHAIPKTARVVGPRVSVQFRPRGVG